jgi:hypothetical protein
MIAVWERSGTSVVLVIELDAFCDGYAIYKHCKIPEHGQDPGGTGV